MDWSDLIAPASGVIVAAVGLWRAQAVAAGKHVVAREAGAAAVVPHLRERLDAQDRRIDGLRDEVEACEKRSAEFARRLTETQAKLERALDSLDEAGRQISALLTLLPTTERARMASLPSSLRPVDES